MTNGHLVASKEIETEAVLLQSAIDTYPDAWVKITAQMREQAEVLSPGAKTSKVPQSWPCPSCRVFKNEKWYDIPEPHHHLTLGVEPR
jgi:rubredoxin